MRRTLVALSTAAALIAGPLVFASNRAEAMVGAPPLGQAAQSINPIEKTACWRLGWRGRADTIMAVMAVTLIMGLAILTTGMAGVPTGAGAGADGGIAGGAGAIVGEAGAAAITVVDAARTWHLHGVSPPTGDV
jgi:hypothetical protein